MAFSKDDIARSIARYLSLMWDKDSGWEIRTAREVVADDQRPVAVILLGAKTTLSARTSRNQGNVLEAVPVTLYAYPPVGETELAARGAGDAIADELNDMIVFGLSPDADEEKDDPAWPTMAGPFHLPLWDYAGVPLEGAGRAGPEEPHATLEVEQDSLNVQNLEDPQDGKRRTIVCEFRVRIDRPGRTVPEGPPVGSMPGTFKPLGSGRL